MIDKNGYERGKYKHSDLIHRQVAFNEIYKKNKKKYPLPFSKYVVHHMDGDKKNNVASNLQIVTQSEHEKIHGIDSKHKTKNKNLFDFEEKARTKEKTLLTPSNNTKTSYKKLYANNYHSVKPSSRKDSSPQIIMSRPPKQYIKKVQRKEEKDGIKKLKKELKEINVSNKEKKREKEVNEGRRINKTNTKEIRNESSGKRIEEKIRGRKNLKVLFASLIILAVISLVIFISQQTQVNPPIQEETPKEELIEVSGSKTDVIIANNKDSAISLEVTYRIYSKWFNKDSTDTKTFEVGPQETKNFQVYFNDGCATSPCSVSIIDYRELN